MSLDPKQNLIASLAAEGFQYDSNSRRAQCPHHGSADSSFNLALNENENGDLLLHCHSHGCSASQVCQSLGIAESELFATDEVKARKQSEAKKPGTKIGASDPQILIDMYESRLGACGSVYSYDDKAGKTCGMVLRFDSEGGAKQFRQISSTDNGWVCEGMPSPRPLYNLPNVIESDFIVVVEGEKAAEVAKSLGYNATTPTQGCKSPHLTDWSVLARKTVWILPDNDEQGWAFADKVLTLLPKSCVVEVRTLSREFELPEGGDIADIVGNPADIIKAISRIPPTYSRVPSEEEMNGRFAGRSVDELWDAAEEPLDWLVEGVFVAEQPTVIGAKQKSLKTTLLSDLVVALATATPWIGKFHVPKKRRVLFITGESSERGSMKRIIRAVESRGFGRKDIGDGLRIETRAFPNLPSASDCLDLSNVVQMFGIEVVIVDPLYMGLQGINSSNLMEVGPALRRFMACCRPASMVLAHHVKKTADYTDAPNLEDLSQAGIAEFAGNYWLMGRLSEYVGDGKHELAVRHGGRDDQFGSYKLDFDESEWKADFTSLADWREQKKMQGEVDKQQQHQRKVDDKVHKEEELYTAKRDIVIGMAADLGTFTSNQICSKGKYKLALDRMAGEGYLEAVNPLTKLGTPGKVTHYRLKEKL